MNILVVDDQEFILAVVRAAMTDRGHVVTSASSGKEALTLSGPFDLALLDVLMPDMNGVELAHLLRQRWPTLPIVFMSAHTGSVTLPVGSTLIDKPFSLDSICGKVEEALNGRQATD